jgi:recombinational DNA repair ATPase RecF
MYVTKLRTTNIRLLADPEFDFTRDGQPRMWTVLLGDNGTCKTTVSQAIALSVHGEPVAPKVDFDPRWLVRKGAPYAVCALHCFDAGFAYRTLDVGAKRV